MKKTFIDFLNEVEQKTKTKTKTKTQASDLDDLFRTEPDQPIAKPEPTQSQDQTKSTPSVDPRQNRASQADTLRATSNITPTDQMRDLMSRMRDIEDIDDTGYPEPEPPEELPSTRVRVDNLPAVAGEALLSAGIQNPQFHKVANLPGNISSAIRTVGKQLFGTFTRTPTSDIWMIGDLHGQGPNTTQEVNAVAGWIRDNGEKITSGEIDFSNFLPGYSAEMVQYSAEGIRWMLVNDGYGWYVYSWPEADSLDTATGIGSDTDSSLARLPDDR